MKKPVTFKDILWWDDKTKAWYHDGKALVPSQVENLISDAKAIRNMSIWKLLVNTGKLKAQTRAFVDANTGNDKKDLAELRKAQEYNRVWEDAEQLIRILVK